ncbi:unnamed protein product, partial [marine sediment metagenome]
QGMIGQVENRFPLRKPRDLSKRESFFCDKGH